MLNFSVLPFFFVCLTETWGNCYNWCYWTGFSCMKHHLCWHNEQEFSAQNDDFLPSHIWHNLLWTPRTMWLSWVLGSSRSNRELIYAVIQFYHWEKGGTVPPKVTATVLPNVQFYFICLHVFHVLGSVYLCSLQKTCSFRSIVSSSPATNYPFSPKKKNTCGTHSNLRRHFPKLSSFWPLKVYFFLLL